MGLLDVENLKMFYKVTGGYVRAVNDVSFSLDRGDIFGIVGESACGKSSLGVTILRVLPPNARLVGGRVQFDGIDLTKLSEDEMRKIRWKRISMIFQSSMSALNPVFKTGDQIVEAFTTHENVSKEEAWEKAAEMFHTVGLPRSRLKDYPHEFSGGMKQRVFIAMSLVCNPDLIIADEPTTALDVVVQDKILQQLLNLKNQLDLTLIIISHDISIIAETCNKMAVMYGGRIVERGETISIFDNPCHPYTSALIQSTLSIRGPLRELRSSIGGRVPRLLDVSEKCPFEPRCPHRKYVCKKQNPPLVDIGKGHFVSCHYSDELAGALSS